MSNEYILRQEELVENPTARIPICLVLDVSGSMEGDPINELQEGFNVFMNTIQSDEVAKYAAEICVVTFGGAVEKKLDFASIERQETPILSTEGLTPMGEAVVLAINLLDARKREYKSAGVDYFQPWLVLMSDGESTDDISLAEKKVNELTSRKQLTVFPIGIGMSANLRELARLSGGRPPLRLKGLNFKEFFVWLSQSVSRVSQSTPGEKVELDLAGIQAWGTI